MIQDIAPHRFYNEFRKNAVPAKDSPVLCFREKSLLIREDEGRICFPTFEQLGLPADVYYAFAVDKTEFFLLTGSCSAIPAGFSYQDIFALRRFAPNVYGMILFTGFHLFSWYNDNVYCGRCGNKTIHSDYERALFCPECSRSIYPRIMPAVIVGVTDGERLLVTKYKEGYGNYALVAGFAEIGETFEETVKREVLEETGLKVKNVTYYKSQPWGIANDILAGYYCETEGSNEIRIDENELRLAQWKLPSEIELQPDSYSLTNEMMKMFKEHGVFWKRDLAEL